MLSLVADYSTPSSSDSEDITDNEDTKDKQSTNYDSPIVKPPLLPSADLILKGGSTKSMGDVLSNPFLKAEKLEIEKLQKHVRMVESENHLLEKNGRKICWNNRKGRCRFGNNCKYAHDSDLVGMEPAVVKKEIKTPANKSSWSFEDNSKGFDLATSNNEKFKTRKRAGLGDSIVPGKRVIKTYQNTKKPVLH